LKANTACAIKIISVSHSYKKDIIVGIKTDFQLLQAEADSIASRSNFIDTGGKPEMFLDSPIEFPVVNPTSYRQLLKDCSNRFPEFRKYLDRGNDWYAEGGTALWLKKQRKPDVNKLLSCVYCIKKINPTSFGWGYHLENDVKIIYHNECKAISIQMETV